MFGRAPRPRFTSQPMRKSFWRSCRLLCERLEDRWLLASVWQNTILPLDVDHSGLCTAGDAIAVLNDLSANGARPLPATRGSAPSNYDPDTDGNGFLTPLDALRVINGLNQTAGEMSLTADLTPQSDPDRNGIVLGASTDWQGQTQPHATVRVTYNNAPESEGETNTGTPLLETTADVAGIFRFSLDLPSRTQILRVEAVDRLGRTAELHREVRVGDAATNWNASMLKVIRDWRSVVNETPTPRVVTAAPPVMAKQLAMVHAAMFDAYQAVVRTHQPYHVDVVAPAGTSAEVAAIAAAHRVASQLYSSVKEMAIWDAALAETEAMASNPTARTQGLSIGQQVGDALLALRTADGSANQVVYTPGNQPGEWTPTEPGFLPALLPQWGQVRPFAIDDPLDYRAPAPPALTSAEYATAVDEVLRLGSQDSTERTADQTEIAQFWADAGGTFTPPGHWNQIASDVLIDQDRSVGESIRTLALLNLALADAAIVCWETKYAYDFWRPIDAIRRADTDGNAATVADPSWTPLLGSPPFPAYTSGHSTFSGAAATVLGQLLGTNTPFTARADESLNTSSDPTARLERSFSNFQQAADEAGMSRIYGGIHFIFDSTAGLQAGQALGQDILTKLPPR